MGLSALTGAAWADAPVVRAVSARMVGGGWTFDVTISHPDTGWDHYASGWEIVAPDGGVLGYRELTHPHVDEQPFTRGLSGVVIPPGADYVLIRPRCTLDGWSGNPFHFDLPR
ncbi:MAG: hypothetical protein KDE03_00395 [Rhodobacteraceae bacterium]|nr:hypothetical protein [Paracoccaceae bacterium]